MAEVDISSTESGAMTAYVKFPADKNPQPAIVVLQEIFGINSFIRQVVDWLGNEGFGAVAPDLFWRQEPRLDLNPTNASDRARAVELMNGLDTALALDDIKTTIEWTKRQDWCDGQVGLLGYCLGGKLAFLASTKGGVAAAVSYYGVGIQGLLDRVPLVAMPLLMHIAERDELCTADAQQQIERAASTSDCITVMRHEGAGHGFARTNGPTHMAAAAQNANAATLQFLSSHLRA